MVDVVHATRAGREWLLGAGTFIGSLGLLLFRFLYPTRVGLTDNGDGWRLTCQLGASEGGRETDQFVQFQYHGGGECGYTDYVASQVWLAKLSQWIGGWFGATAKLDLVTLGVIGAALAAAGVTAVVLGLPLSYPWRILAALLLLLVAADSAFFPYHAAVTTEGAAFLGIMLTVGGLLLLNRPGRWRWAGTVVVVLGGVMAINAKVQTLTIWPVLVLAVLFARRYGRGWPRRWAPGLLALLAVTGTTLVLHGTMNRAERFDATAEMNMYNTVFNSIVDGHHDTGGDLEALGLPPSFARYVGTRIWGNDSARNDPLYPRYADRFTRENVLRYYWTHPERTWEILDRSATDLMLTRADYQGNFSIEAGYGPAAKEFRVPVLSGGLGLVASAGLSFLGPLWLLIAVVAVWASRRGRREIAVVLLFLLGVALGQFLSAALGEGIENTKHQIVAAYCTALATVLMVVGLLPRGRKASAEPESASGEPAGEPDEPEDEPALETARQ